MCGKLKKWKSSANGEDDSDEEEASTSVMEMKMMHSPKLVQGMPLSLSLRGYKHGVGLARLDLGFGS